MITSRGTSSSVSYQHNNNNNQQGFRMYEGLEDLLDPSSSPPGSDTNSHVLLYNLSVLKEKVQELQSAVTIVLSPCPVQHEPVAVTAGALIQDVIVAASSMMYAFQQLALANSIAPCIHDQDPPQHHIKSANYHDDCNSVHLASREGMDHVVLHNSEGGRRREFIFDGAQYNTTNNSSNNNNKNNKTTGNGPSKRSCLGDKGSCSKDQYSQDVVELDASDLLAKYTHFCQVCGKGFKRDANLRMHMRAHGDEYKTNEALSNPLKKGNNNELDDDDLVINRGALRKYYSCPQEGCRWNKKHAKFQPLKSLVCVKNHYKRSHCPKMYVCNRCNRKHFSVLSDLRTHEKHCGDHLRWRCSCGTTFSRKDKLMGHLALFLGHAPAKDQTAPTTMQGNFT